MISMSSAMAMEFMAAIACREKTRQLYASFFALSIWTCLYYVCIYIYTYLYTYKQFKIAQHLCYASGGWWKTNGPSKGFVLAKLDLLMIEIFSRTVDTYEKVPCLFCWSALKWLILASTRVTLVTFKAPCHFQIFQAAVLIVLFGFGLLRHRMLKRRAMAAAVAVAVGDIPAPPSSSCLDILPKTGAANWMFHLAEALYTSKLVDVSTGSKWI